MNRNLGRTMAALSATLIALLSVFSLGAQTPASATGPSRPNIILILADNVGYGDLGCYGQTKIKTPVLDKLASEGIRFTSFYAGSPEDAPARAALMTGLEPPHSGGGFNRPLAADAVTVAAILKQAGYRTGLIGNWSLGDIGPARPPQKGFDEFAGFLSQNHARQFYTDRLWRHDPVSGFEGQVEFPQNRDGQRGFFMPDMLTTSSMNFVRNNKPEPHNNFRPFFLCIAYPIPHPGAPLNFDPYAKEPWSQAEKDRAALITRMDEGVGKVLERLTELKIETNTVVIFTSVNGPLNESGSATDIFKSTGPLRGLQGSVYEGGLRVPMIIRWPAGIKTGQVSDLPWVGWDLLPTVVEMVSGPAPQKTDGISILPTLTGRPQTARHEQLYWETKESGLKQALREGDWKAVRIGTNAVELYNLKTDAGEKQNVAARNASVVERMEKALQGARQ